MIAGRLSQHSSQPFCSYCIERTMCAAHPADKNGDARAAQRLQQRRESRSRFGQKRRRDAIRAAYDRKDIAPGKLVMLSRNDQVEIIGGHARSLALHGDGALRTRAFYGNRKWNALSSAAHEQAGPRWTQFIARVGNVAEGGAEGGGCKPAPWLLQLHTQRTYRKGEPLREAEALILHAGRALRYHPTFLCKRTHARLWPARRSRMRSGDFDGSDMACTGK